MRLVFMGSADFGVPALHALAGRHDVAAVVTRKDAEKGRGRRLAPTPVKETAISLGIPVLQPGSLRDPSFLRELSAFRAELFYVVAFRILPPEVFTIPPHGTVNLHASLLPDYRGAAPINWAVVNGETETGLTTFFIDKNIDTGDIIFQEHIAIDPDETAGELYERMKPLGADLSLRTLDVIADGVVKSTAQPGVDTAQRILHAAPKLSKDDGRIDWNRPALDVHNRVRGMNPYPGSFAEWSGGVLKIRRTEVADGDWSDQPGTVCDVSPREGITVACGDGAVRLVEVQPPGKRPMGGAEFVRGYPVTAGQPLSGKGHV